MIGEGGSAQAFLQALPDARVFSRRGEWPPDAAGARPVVNATPVRDELLVELGPGQTRRRPALPGDGDDRAVAAARAAGCE